MLQTASKSIYTSLPSIKNKIPSHTASNEKQINDAPRAGQHWQIQSVFFNFPKAEKTEAIIIVGGEAEFIIQLLIGGLIVAEQKFLETAPATASSTPMRLVGSLEPFVPAIVNPGQDVTIAYSLVSYAVDLTIETGSGITVLNYVLEAGESSAAGGISTIGSSRLPHLHVPPSGPNMDPNTKNLIP
jgi:hypothetical protein